MEELAVTGKREGARAAEASEAIYLDYNATTPLDPAVIAEMKPAMSDLYGNPSSSHWCGVRARRAVDVARRRVAAALHCHTDEVVFTSGGSESNNHAIKGYAMANKHRGKHIITSAVEHVAVLEVCRYLEQHEGFRITVVGVDAAGVVDIAALSAAICPDTILITVMLANNEVGTIQPISEIAHIARKHNIAVHSDAAQCVGKMQIDVSMLDVDMLTIVGHKCYAPKGIGALYVRRGVVLHSLIHGAPHETARRAGTENTLHIVALGKACEVAESRLDVDIKHMMFLRDRLYDGLKSALKLRLNGHPEHRLPNTLNVSIADVEASTLLAELDHILAVSAGAACHSDLVQISHVLTAMKVPLNFAKGTIRFSVGRYTTAQEIDRAIALVTQVAQQVSFSSAGGRTQVLTPPSPVNPVPAPLHVTIQTQQGELEVASSPARSELLDLVLPPPETVCLTRYTSGLGCACKMRPQSLEQVLKQLATRTVADQRILVGLETGDDAAVFRVTDEIALVATVDFFTPVVDDAYAFGAIAAANAISDVYAMGGVPVFALNIVGFPSNRLPLATLGRILQGAEDKAAEAGMTILGGHTIEDVEPKFGMSVTGFVHPTKIKTNARAKPGDILIITKPLGTGIITTAIKRGLASPSTIKAAIETMGTLNKSAAEAMNALGDDVHSCTDVTGFGLLGHLKGMTVASSVNAEIILADVPLLPDVVDLAVSGSIPGGSKNNASYVSDYVKWGPTIPDHMKYIACDAQTSGGLLMAVAPHRAAECLSLLQQNGVQVCRTIGCITQPGNGCIVVK